jgi:type II secretory pathway pseudopilin PulG
MRRRGFTLIELLVAGMMTTIVIGGITTSLSQLGSAKSVSRQRLEAFSRCDTAIRTLRRDIITTLRRGDLFDTRILISDLTHRFQGNVMNQDELLVFNGTLRANKEIDFNGEGMEYETQFRIEPNDVSSALWKRRDAILDDNPVGGGMAIPIADGIVALQFEAFDGISWYSQWDSDELGIPHAIRISVTSTGMVFPDETNAPLITLRTIVPLDRYQTPDDKRVLIAQEEEEARLAALGIETGDGELDLSSGTDGSGGSGSGGSGSGGKDSSSDGGSGTDTSNKQGTTIIDPDGNEHDIPPDP